MPAGGAELVMIGATVAAAMTTELFWVALGNVPLATWTVKLNEPAVVGVPFNTPLVPLSVRPAGNVPLAMLQVIGAVPLAVKVWL